MNKVLLSFIFMFISTSLYAGSADKTKEITAMLGVPFTITPYIDLGLAASYVSNSSNYTISNATAFSIVSNVVLSSYGDPKAYSYTLTPQKTGFYTFTQTIYTSAYSPYSRVMTYNITVVDLTAINLGTSSLTLQLGDNYQFNPILTHPSAQTTFTWQSSNTSVATISEGMISAVGLGTTTITCTAHNGVSAQCEVTVNPILVSSVTLNDTEAELTVGEKLQLETTIAPDNATDKSVTWSSSNQSVTVVNESGQVTAVGLGICQIKATANDGSGKTASCLVTVTNSTPAPSLQGDLNGDGIMSVTDVLLLINLILQQ